MKKFLGLILAISQLILIAPAIMADAINIYVSTTGTDHENTQATQENPLKTLSYAVEFARTVRSDGQKVVIHMAEGIYRQTGAVVLEQGDSNTEIVGNNAILRGSVKFTKDDFSLVTDQQILDKLPESARGKVYKLDLTSRIGPTIPYKEYFSQGGDTAYYSLYSGGTSLQLARWPNYDFSLTGSPVSDRAFSINNQRAYRWKDTQQGMIYSYFRHDWAPQPIYIDAIDDIARTINLKKAPDHGIIGGMRYYAFNMIEELDIAGEWVIDQNDSFLYYYPINDFADDLEFSYGDFPIINIRNNANNITLQGLTMEMTRFMGVDVVYGNSNDNIVVKDCIVRNMGRDGVNLGTSRNSVVEDSEIYNIGATGVVIYGGDRFTLVAANNIVRNCQIYNFGQVFRSYCGAITLNGVGNKALNNVIHDAPHLAIWLGGNDNIIQNNEIYNVVTQSSDSGAIYTGRSWINLGNIINNNYFHDVKKDTSLAEFEAHAVYIDDMASGVIISDNYFENCSSALLVGGGHYNEISGNIVNNCDKGFDYDTRGKRGGWARDWILPGGSIYEGMMSFINDDKCDKNVFYTQYPYFESMLAEATSQEQSVDAGIPKGVGIINNKHYGAMVDDHNYNEIEQDVIENGTYHDNTSRLQAHMGNQDGYGNINMELIGATLPFDFPTQKLSGLVPENGQIVREPNVTLVWDRIAGAEKYNLVISRDSRLTNPIFDLEITNNYFDLQALINGATYYWKVDVINGTESVTIEGDILKFYVNHNEAAGVLASDDFSNYQPVVFDTIGTHILGDWTIHISAPGDSAEIAVDSITGKKALKLVKGSNSGELSANYTFPQVTQGKVKVAFEGRAQNHSKSLVRFPSIRTSSGVEFGRAGTYEDGYWIHQTGEINDFWIGSFGKFHNSYGTFLSYCDIDNGLYNLETYQNGVLDEQSPTVNSMANSVGNMRIVINNDDSIFKPGKSTDGSGDNKGVYWIGGVTVSKHISDITTAATEIVNVRATSHAQSISPGEISEIAGEELAITVQINSLTDEFAFFLEAGGYIWLVNGGNVTKINGQYIINHQFTLPSEAENVNLFVWKLLPNMIPLSSKFIF